MIQKGYLASYCSNLLEVCHLWGATFIKFWHWCWHVSVSLKTKTICKNTWEGGNIWKIDCKNQFSKHMIKYKFRRNTDYLRHLIHMWCSRWSSACWKACLILVKLPDCYFDVDVTTHSAMNINILLFGRIADLFFFVLLSLKQTRWLVSLTNFCWYLIVALTLRMAVFRLNNIYNH